MIHAISDAADLCLLHLVAFQKLAGVRDPATKSAESFSDSRRYH